MNTATDMTTTWTYVEKAIMTKERRSFVRESPEQRRLDLIQATLEVIGDFGFGAATTRAIAARADVTLGLIRHYFSTKEDLISAAYEYHMEEMTRLALAPIDMEASAKVRLIAVIRANLTAPVLTERNVTLWASFIAQIANEPDIHATHYKTYLMFRNKLEALIVAVVEEANRSVSSREARHLATVINAVIDGLWMEGGASSSEFESDDLVQIALDKIGSILGLNLTEKGLVT